MIRPPEKETKRTRILGPHSHDLAILGEPSFLTRNRIPLSELGQVMLVWRM
jgi:hypothetical protein